jgi:hypothetical protein
MLAMNVGTREKPGEAAAAGVRAARALARGRRPAPQGRSVRQASECLTSNAAAISRTQHRVSKRGDTVPPFLQTNIDRPQSPSGRSPPDFSKGSNGSFAVGV